MNFVFDYNKLKVKFNLLPICVVLVIGIFFFVFSNSTDLPVSYSALLILFIVTISPFVLRAKKKRLDPFEPLTLALLGILIYFVFPAIDLVFFSNLIDSTVINLSHYRTSISENDDFLAKVIFLSAIGVISFYLGYFGLSKMNKSSILLPGITYSKNKLLIMGSFYVLLGVVFFIYSMWKIGGASQWFTIYRSKHIFLVAKSIYGMFGLNIFIPAVIILFVYALKRNHRIVYFLWTLLFIALIFYNVISASRRTSLFLILSIFILYHYGIKSIRLKKLVLVTVLLFSFNYTMLFVREVIHTHDRGAINTAAKNSLLVNQWHTPLITSMDFACCYNSLMQIVDYVPEKVDYLWGSTYAKFFFWPIPRSYWPEKPETISRIVVRQFYPEDVYQNGVSMSPTIIGEAYFNFGAIGIVVVMVLFGIICQVLHIFIKKNRGNIGAIAIYASVAPYIFESFRGYFFECTAVYLFIGISVFMAFYAARYRQNKAVNFNTDESGSNNFVF